MILTTTRHGRTRRDARYLFAHLSRQEAQRSRVVHVAAPVTTAPEALDYMQALRDGSRATVACHHISLSPSQPLTDEQREEAVARILAAFGAEDHAHVLWEHAGKPRRGADTHTHYHLVVAHVGPDGKALDDSRSYVRLEAVARSLEADFGHDLTPSRRTAAVAAELERTGRPDVAVLVRGEAPPEPPQSAMSSRQRARAERRSVSLPDVRVAVRTAWEQSDTPAALRAALAEHGLGVAAGNKPGVWVVTGPDDTTLGALDRLAGQRRRDVAAHMQETPTDDPADPTPGHARAKGDIRRSQGRAHGGRGPEPSAVPAGPRPTRRGVPSGRSGGSPADDPHRAGADADGDRGASRSPRRVDAALAAAALTRAAQDRGTRRELRRLQRMYRPKGRDILDARRLARVDLDELRRLAEDLARGWTSFLTRAGRPAAPPLSHPATDPHAALRARLREAAAAPPRAVPVPRPDDDEPAAAHRPRF